MRVLERGDVLGGALGDDPATTAAALGPEVDQPVGALDDVEVVLDDDDRVALVDQALEHAEQLADVLEVQAGGRLVEHVDGAPGGALLQLGGELDPLRLTAGQGGRGLAEPDVAEPDVVERLHVPGDGGHRLEEVGGLLDRHVEHVGDRLALEVHLERLAVVAGAVADLARHVDVGEEVHLDLDRAVAGARVAAPALDVEREPPGLVAADLRLGRGGEQLADVVEDAGVGGRVGARGAPDRALVDVHDLVEVLEPGDRLVPAGHVPGAVELVGEHVVEDVVDQRRLARAGDAGDRDEVAERERHRHLVEVVLASACTTVTSRPFSCGRRTPGVGISRRPERYLPVIESGWVSRSATVPECTTWPPCSPAPGPMSTTQSAAGMVSSSCSTTMSVLPRSRSRVRVSISRWLSRWCRPMLGSSST